MPFERAYEIWTREMFIYQESLVLQRNTKKRNWRTYGKINWFTITSSRKVLFLYYELQLHYKDKLLLDKKKLKKFPITKKGMEQGNLINLQMFEQLNHISSDIK